MLTQTLFAADFTASISRTKIGNGETFTVSFTINTNASDFKPPQFNDFRLVGGPNQSTSTQWVNGVVSQSHTFSYVLLAVKEGVFTIKPATIKADNKTLQSNELTIEVVKASPQQQQQHHHNQQQHAKQQQQTIDEEISKNMFLKVLVDKTKPYVGEQITLTFKLYQRVNLVNLGFNKLPALNGFWSELIEDKNAGNIHFQSEVLDGVAYNVAEIRKFVLFPQRSGTLEIDPLGLDCIVRTRTNHRQSFFGSFEDIKYEVASNPVKIQVLPLPENGKPSGFKGAVGKFSLEARLDKSKVKAHEAINLLLNISGKGNFPLLETPAPVFPLDMEVYDPKVTDKFSVSLSGASGSKSYEYLIIPRYSGSFTIEPVNFTYFDPVLKSYQTLSTGSFDIEVEKGDREEEGGLMISGKRKEDIKTVGNDIRYIKTQVPEFVLSNKFFFGSAIFYFLITLPFVLFAGFVIGLKRHNKLNSDHVRVKSKMATKIAVKRLELAKKHLLERDETQFYNEIFKALFGYLGDKLNMPIVQLNKDNIAYELKSKAVSEQIINKVTNTLDLCEMARFAPITDISVQTVYNDTVEVITQIEDQLK